MPYKHISKLIPEQHDKRIKLSTEDKALICQLYATGEYSKRQLARDFNVSPRTIQFTLDPDKRKANYDLRVAKGGSTIYYDKDKHTEAMRKHRQHKQELYLADKLIDTKE